ncbi:unnamed protein product [Brachionus calyciflorus]|uniref:Eukaryotic translation initiation factor 4E n=1 Tax=Brachionus calyciflorus TaxID=104777 RepID=A0A814G9P5_9BILA|nr:unnamed protein product [Brachionus calyciflorus]
MKKSVSFKLPTEEDREVVNASNIQDKNKVDIGVIEITNDDDLYDPELHNSWSFYVDRNEKYTNQEDFIKNLHLICKFKTVKTFWSYFNNLPEASTLPMRYSYHIMRNDLRPMWEDEENSNGGLWKLKCKNQDSSKIWLEIVLALIGETLTNIPNDSDEIIGVTFGRREREDCVQIWNYNHNFEKEAHIAENLKRILPDTNFTLLNYKPHSELDLSVSLKNANDFKRIKHDRNYSNMKKTLKE